MAQNWIRHTFRRQRFQTQTQAATLAVLGIFIALVLGALYLSQVASFAITNREIQDLIDQRNELERTNEQLIAEIASFRTVPRLLARAQEIGFRPATNADIEYLVVDGYNPEQTLDITNVSHAEIQLEPVPEYDETFGGWIEQQLASLRQQFETFGN
jgi:cell division protein FtsL